MQIVIGEIDFRCTGTNFMTFFNCLVIFIDLELFLIFSYNISFFDFRCFLAGGPGPGGPGGRQPPRVGTFSFVDGIRMLCWDNFFKANENLKGEPCLGTPEGRSKA